MTPFWPCIGVRFGDLDTPSIFSLPYSIMTVESVYVKPLANRPSAATSLGSLQDSLLNLDIYRSAWSMGGGGYRETREGRLRLSRPLGTVWRLAQR